ncbi:MAG TPA: hypothetical protein VGE18_01885 [Candidatus Paceibacterota bacterium]
MKEIEITIAHSIQTVASVIHFSEKGFTDLARDLSNANLKRFGAEVLSIEMLPDVVLVGQEN